MRLTRTARLAALSPSFSGLNFERSYMSVLLTGEQESNTLGQLDY